MYVEAKMTSGGTIEGLSLNFSAWIRDDGQLPVWGMPDSDNDEARSS